MVDVKNKYTIFAYVEMFLAVIASASMAPYTMSGIGSALKRGKDKRTMGPIFYGAPLLPVIFRFSVILLDKQKFPKAIEIYMCICCAVLYIIAGIMDVMDRDDHDETFITFIRGVAAVACGVLLLVDMIMSQFCNK